jgi:hypothetical protein
MLEQLEQRMLLSGPQNVQLELAGTRNGSGPYTPGLVDSYAGVGFQENDVGWLLAQVNGQPDTSPSDFSAQINWGDGQSARGDLVYMGNNGSSAAYLIKGSHTYEKANTLNGYAITVTVNGPDGSSTNSQTSTADVFTMPSGKAGTQPSPVANSSAPENVQLQLAGTRNGSGPYTAGTVDSYARVGFQENDVDWLLASVKGQPDTNLKDFSVQINWGDSSSWTTGDLV